jgi:hypothetical protein
MAPHNLREFATQSFFRVFVFSSLVLCGLVGSVFASSFTDVSTNDEHSVAINWLSDLGVVEGYEDGSYGQDQAVTRAETLKIFLLAFSHTIEEDSQTASIFSDVLSEEWYYPYVSTAVNLGIVNGYNDGTFAPSAQVSRAEAMKMLIYASGQSSSEPGSSPFEDVQASDWFASYAQYGKDWNVSPPETDGLWGPHDAVSRADLAEMVYRITETKKSQSSFDESTNWIEQDFPTVNVSLKVPFGWYMKQDGVGAIWLHDSANGQVSLLQPYSNGGTLLMSSYSNSEGVSAGQLWNQIISDGMVTSGGATTDQDTIKGFSTLNVFHPEGSLLSREWYLMLSDGSVVHFQAMRGDGAYADYLDEYLEMIVESVSYNSSGEVSVGSGSSSSVTPEEAVSSIRQVIQADGYGQDAMELLSDLQLIETDVIGVGTGPVDYYYSPSADITIKYERSFDVILDLEEGQTTAF